MERATSPTTPTALLSTWYSAKFSKPWRRKGMKLVQYRSKVAPILSAMTPAVVNASGVAVSSRICKTWRMCCMASSANGATSPSSQLRMIMCRVAICRACMMSWSSLSSRLTICMLYVACRRWNATVVHWSTIGRHSGGCCSMSMFTVSYAVDLRLHSLQSSRCVTWKSFSINAAKSSCVSQGPPSAMSSRASVRWWIAVEAFSATRGSSSKAARSLPNISWTSGVGIAAG
mmetsp:Transcript_1038/g.3375  ORF Transcript_1038/g.3375 Transcript_1038/m.3375 type:complete len:231 (-) Transcript_1038:1343-2035(-)